MEEEKYWMRFIQSGRIDDYLKYSSAKKTKEISEGVGHAVYDRSVGYKGNEYRGERPSGNTSYS